MRKLLVLFIFIMLFLLVGCQIIFGSYIDIDGKMVVEMFDFDNINDVKVNVYFVMLVLIEKLCENVVVVYVNVELNK